MPVPPRPTPNKSDDLFFFACQLVPPGSEDFFFFFFFFFFGGGGGQLKILEPPYENPRPPSAPPLEKF